MSWVLSLTNCVEIVACVSEILQVESARPQRTPCALPSIPILGLKHQLQVGKPTNGGADAARVREPRTDLMDAADTEFGDVAMVQAILNHCGLM